MKTTFVCLILSSVLFTFLLISCEDNIVRSNQYDPDSENTIIGNISGRVSPASSNAIVSAKKGNTIFQSKNISSGGNFILENLPEGGYKVIVQATNFVTDSSLINIQVVPKETFDVGVIYLNSSIHGTIFGVIEPYDPDILVVVAIDDESIDSTGVDQDSKFSFSMLDPETYSIQIQLSGYASYNKDQIVVSAGVSTNVGTIVLNDITKGSITGYISPKSSSAIVTLMKDGSIIDSTAIDPITGQYLFTNLDPSTYDLSIFSEGYATGYISDIDVVGGQTNEGNDFYLQETGEIKGTVYPTTINALVKAYIGAELVDSTHINSLDGSFNITNLEPEYYNLTISAQSWITDQSQIQIRVDAGGSTILDRIYLAPEGSNTIYGKVINQSNSYSITSATLKLDDNETTTDMEGYFAFYSIDPGYKNILTEKEGFLSTYSSASIPTLGSVSINIPLIPSGALSGYTKDSQTNSGVNNVRVSIDNDDFVTYSDETGYYYFEDLPSGNHSLVASKEDYTSTSDNFIIVSGENQSLDLALVPFSTTTGSLTGNVKDFYTNSNIEDASILVNGLMGFSDNNGNYTIEYIPAGENSVLIEHQDYVPQTETVDINVGQTASLNIVSFPKDSSFSLPTGTVSGVLMDMISNTIINYTATAISNPWLTYQPLIPDPMYPSNSGITNGLFEIWNMNYAGGNNPHYNTPNIPIGIYYLWFQEYYTINVGNFGYKEGIASVEVNEGSNSFELYLQPLCSIGGSVTDLNTGFPLPGVNILGATSNDDGSFYKNKVDPDLEFLSFIKEGYYPESTSVALLGGQHNLLEVIMTPLPTVNGVVTDASSGETLNNVEITSSTAQTTFTNSNGIYEIVFTAEGESSINFAMPGYSNFSTILNIPYTGSINLDVALVQN